MNTRIEIIKKYLEEDPSDSFLRYALALEFMELKETEKAYSQLEKLINDDPDYLASYYMAGKTAEELGKNDEALKWYSEGILIARDQQNQNTLNELNAAKSLLE